MEAISLNNQIYWQEELELGDFIDVPHDILNIILSFLPEEDLVSLELTNKRWSKISFGFEWNKKFYFVNKLIEFSKKIFEECGLKKRIKKFEQIEKSLKRDVNKNGSFIFKIHQETDKAISRIAAVYKASELPNLDKDWENLKTSNNFACYQCYQLLLPSKEGKKYLKRMHHDIYTPDVITLSKVKKDLVKILSNQEIDDSKIYSNIEFLSLGGNFQWAINAANKILDKRSKDFAYYTIVKSSDSRGYSLVHQIANIHFWERAIIFNILSDYISQEDREYLVLQALEPLKHSKDFILALLKKGYTKDAITLLNSNCLLLYIDNLNDDLINELFKLKLFGLIFDILLKNKSSHKLHIIEEVINEAKRSGPNPFLESLILYQPSFKSLNEKMLGLISNLIRISCSVENLVPGSISHELAWEWVSSLGDSLDEKNFKDRIYLPIALAYAHLGNYDQAFYIHNLMNHPTFQIVLHRALEAKRQVQ